MNGETPTSSPEENIPGIEEFHPGQLIGGRYEVICAIGTGGTASIFRVLDRVLNDDSVALKFLAPAFSQKSENVARLKNEVLLARRLGHPNIVRVYDLGATKEGQLFITMELVEGKNLFEYLQGTEQLRLDLNQVRTVLLDLAAALDYAHERGVVHRDVKPENVFISERGEFKLGDFGSAFRPDVKKRLTREGIAIGTPGYLAPEQLLSVRVDGRADIYALGIIAYELATGRMPTLSSNQLTVALNGEESPFPLLSDFPWWFQNFVETCAESDPDNRYQRMSEVLEVVSGWSIKKGDGESVRERGESSIAKRITRLIEAIRG